jgi:hypothetical protein
MPSPPLPTRPTWRALFHGGLGAFASPLPGGVVAGSRLLAAGRPLPALTAFLLGLAGTAVVWGAALLLPLAAPLAAAVAVLLAAGGGMANSWLERRLGAVPRLRAPGERRIPLRLALWACVVPIAWLPVAWMLAMLTSRWGPELIFKPSFQGRILLAALWLAPLGAALGLARATLERRFGLGAPVAFAATLPALFLATAAGSGSVALLLDLWLLPARNAWPPAFAGNLLPAFEWVCLLVLGAGAAEYLGGAAGLRSFLLRTVVLCGLGSVLSLHWAMVTSAVPVAMRERAAYRDAARGREGAAEREWNWILTRAPETRGACRAIEQGALAALRGGDVAGARAALERARPPLTGEFPCSAIAGAARALLAAPAATPSWVAARAEPVRPESYLSDDWSAALTAIRAARPDESEVRLKNRLRLLSRSPDDVTLPPMDGFDDLRLAARLLGAEALAVPAERALDLLRSGRPLLFRDPVRGRWGVLEAIETATGATLWLDFRRWDRERERPLTRAEARQIVTGAEATGLRAGEVEAEVRRLGVLSLLRESLALDGGWLAVLVPRAPDGAFPVPPGASAAASDRLARLWEARHLVDRGAWLAGARRATGLARGPAREEVLALCGLGLRLPEAEDREGPPGALAATAPLLLPARLEHLSPWALRGIDSLAGRLPEIACGVRRAALEALLRLEPDEPRVLRALLDRSTAEGRAAETAALALSLARAESFDRSSVLEGLQAVAPLAAGSPDARAALGVLLRHLPWPTPAAASETPQARAALAPYCAARAVLAARPEQAIGWWRRAVEIDPGRATYLHALEALLRQAGRPEEAAEVSRRFDEVRGVERCEAEAR